MNLIKGLRSKLLLISDIWDQARQDYVPKGMCFSGTHIYQAIYGPPPNFFEVDILTGAMIDKSHPTDGGDLLNLVWDGTYVWTTTGNTPVSIWRFNPSDDSWVIFLSEFAYATSNCVQTDGTNMWVAAREDPGKFFKFEVTSGNWTEYTLSVAGTVCRKMVFDGTHMWIGCSEPHEGITKMDPSDGSFIHVPFDAGDAGSEQLDFDGTYVWTACDVNPTRIKRIDPSDNSHITITLPAGNYGVRSVVWDGKYVWFGQKPVDKAFVQLNPVDNSYRVWGDIQADARRSYSMSFDGQNVWSGCDGTVKKLIRMRSTR